MSKKKGKKEREKRRHLNKTLRENWDCRPRWQKEVLGHMIRKNKSYGHENKLPSVLLLSVGDLTCYFKTKIKGHSSLMSQNGLVFPYLKN